MPEENPGYCRKGCYIYCTRCTSCSREFVANEKKQNASGVWLSLRASSNAPIYYCRGDKRQNCTWKL